MTWEEVYARCDKIVMKICSKDLKFPLRIYGIPRGGIIPASLVCEKLNNSFGKTAASLCESPLEANCFIDDIVDSEKTKRWFMETYLLHKPSFHSLVNKKKSKTDYEKGWISFPWERMDNKTTVEDNIIRILQHIGEDVGREGLVDTPARVIRSWNKLFGGYKEDPKSIITTFSEEQYDEMVLVKDIEFYSTCEHHMLPFYGKAHIAYIPKKSIIGVSKLARLLEIYARRLQIQERICDQVVNDLMSLLNPLGAACIIEAQHFCMTARGVEKQSAKMRTTSLRGVFREDPKARQELLLAIG